MRVVAHFAKWLVGLAPAETQTTAAERDCLVRHARGCRRIVEIGVWHGVTTARLRGVMAPDGVLYAVDPFPPGRLGVSFQRWIARREVARVRNGRVCWLRLTGEAAARAYAALGVGPVEFLFIDGDHSYEGIRADWEGWRDLVARGGAVALHDSRPTPLRPLDGAGSVIFTEQVVRCDPWFSLVDEVDSLTVFRRVARP